MGSPPAPFRGPARLAIAGVGLIGGSIALAARRAWPDVRIAAVDLPAVLDVAADRGVIDEPCESIAALAPSDLLAVAVPPEALDRTFAELCAAGFTGLVTDTGSTKRRACDLAARYGLTRFVGGHPMAGAAHGGLAHARADLFADRPWAIVPGRDASAGDVEVVSRMVRAFGAHPLVIDAAAHDRTMAYVSHVPQLVATALMHAAGETLGREGLALAGPALREMTRLAASPAPLWRGIIADNRDEVRIAAARVRDALDALVAAGGDDAFDATFARAQAWRDALERGSS